MATMVETHATRWLARRDARVLRQAIEQGIEQGIEKERAEWRTLLCRMAELRFDAATAKRLAEVIEHIDNPDRLNRVGEWLVTCESGAEFLARIANGHLPNGAPNLRRHD